MSKRSKACDISKKVREKVLERDNHRCIFCGSPSQLTIAHYISRAKGGLGIEENLVVACANCHLQLDYGTNDYSKAIKRTIANYLNHLYPSFLDQDRKYNKWMK